MILVQWQRWACTQVLQMIACSALSSGLWIQFLQGLNATSLSNRQNSCYYLFSSIFPPYIFLGFVFSNKMFIFLLPESVYYIRFPLHGFNILYALSLNILSKSYFEIWVFIEKDMSRQFNSSHGFEPYIGLQNSAINVISLISLKIGSPTHSLP